MTRTDTNTTWMPARYTQPEGFDSPQFNDFATIGATAVAVGEVNHRFVGQFPGVWVSTDGGRSWTIVRNLVDSGKEGSIHAVTALGDELVAVGDINVGDHSGSGMDVRPGSWHSSDGTVWTADQPLAATTDNFNYFTGAASIDGIAVALDAKGRVYRRARIGEAWARVGVPQAHPDERPSSIVALRRRLVMFGGAAEDDDQTLPQYIDRSTGRIWTSDDAGLTWERVDPQTDAWGDRPHTPRDLAEWNGHLYAIAVVNGRSDPQFCYQDHITCQDIRTAVVFSADGVNWERSTLKSDRWRITLQNKGQWLDGFDRGAAAPSVRGNDATELAVIWVLTSGDAPAERPEAPTTTVPPLDFLKPDIHQLEVGKRYRYWYEVNSFYSAGGSCGGLEFNGKSWRVAASTAPGAYPEHWPADWPVRVESGTDTSRTSVFGTIELVSPDRIEVGIEGKGAIWTLAPYVPRPTAPPGCE